MDRETQLSNVAFGGAWSEEIAGQEALQEARQVLEEAVEQCAMVDLRRDAEVNAAVQLLAAQHPKGVMLAQAWGRACSMKASGVAKI